MKKIMLYIMLVILFCFLIPIIFTNKFEPRTVESSRNQILENNSDINKNNENTTALENINNNYDYKQYKTIKLLHTNTNEVQEIGLDEYLYGVVAAEMPATFELEALKAQALVARTYTIYKIISGKKHPNADICTASTCCQAWISKEKRFEKWESRERTKQLGQNNNCSK